MAKLRNISPDEREVPLVGRFVGVDEVIEVPDDVYEAHSWPEETWAVVAAPKPGKSAPITKEV